MGYTSSNGYSCSNPDDPEATLTADCSGEGEVIRWTPERDTIPPNELSSSTWRSSYYRPDSYDRGLVYVSSSTGTHGLSGNYYNWPAAVASNYSLNYGSNGNVAANSVCPAGWRLPNTASMEGGYEFSKLLYKYGITTDDKNTNGYAADGYNKIISNPIYFNLSGEVTSGGSLYYSGTNGRYQSSAVAGYTYFYRLIFSENSISLSGSGVKNTGVPIRCLAK